ncbi:hypothetical protein CUC04_05695 [Prevotella intermedia]|uniref:Uncharacterized protein n=1 Tax=Prevotella intermedia TaxID=28131 RepID=A0A2G9IH70_PREIN|nr:hypothetical protein CUC04_05695 [Prevotella intermedia]
MFRIPKAAILYGKSVGFASQKSRFRNAKAQIPFSNRTIFTKIAIILQRRYSATIGKLFP